MKGSIPHVPLSNDQKLRHEAILRLGNVKLQFWFERIGRNRFRTRTMFRNAILACTQGVVKIGDNEIPAADVAMIRDVKNIEMEVLGSYSRLLSKLSHRPVRRHNHDVLVSFDDLYMEAVRIALICIHYFTKEDHRFSTYLTHCVRRHLGKMCARMNPRSEYSIKAVDLYRKFEDTKRKINGPCNFEEIVDLMDISEKEREVLTNMLVCVLNQSNIQTTSLSEGDRAAQSDYPVLGQRQCGPDGREVFSRCGRHGGSPIFCKNSDDSQFELRTAVSRAGLSTLERAVVDGFLSSQSDTKTNLGLSEVAGKLINPDTNRPFSRMAISLAWKRAKQKILSAYRYDLTLEEVA